MLPIDDDFEDEDNKEDDKNPNDDDSEESHDAEITNKFANYKATTKMPRRGTAFPVRFRDEYGFGYH